MGPLRLAGLLYLGAAITVLPWALRGPRAQNRWRARNVARLAGVIVFGGVLGPIALLFGLTRAPASSVALWLSLETVFTALFAVLLFREHVGARGWIAVVVITAASIAIASPSEFEAGTAALLVATACACWGLDNNLTAVIDGFTPAQSTFAKGLAAGATNLALSAVVGDARLELGDVGYALAIGALAYGASLVLYVAGAQQLGATRSQMIFSSAPFFGAALAWAALGESLTIVHVLGALAMAAALVFVHRDQHAHEHDHEALVHTHWHRHDDAHHDHSHPGVAASAGHTHEHAHTALTHSHAHEPDLHHRHAHSVADSAVRDLE